MRLLPLDVKFYDQLLGQASLAVEAAALLRAASETGGDRIGEASQRLHDLEHQGDDLEHEVFRHIHKTFITPIDPEDIQSISSALDRVTDAVEAIGYRLHAYGFTEVPERMQGLARVLEDCTKALQDIFATLNEHGVEQQEVLTAQCIRVNEIENQSQTLARDGVAEVFARVRDPIELMRLKAIYDHFEMAGDRCEEVADLIENVLAKNS